MIDAPPQILYWKWDDAIFQESVLERKIDDMCQRAGFDLHYVSFHWMNRSFFDPELLEAIGRASERYREHGRGFMLDIDLRTEGAEFTERYAGESSSFLQFHEAVLDENGRAIVEVAPVEVHRFGKKRVTAADAVVAAWAFRLSQEDAFARESLADITATVRVESHRNGSRLIVEAGMEQAGKKALLFPRFQHVVPDLFSSNLYPYFNDMFEAVRELPLAGVGIDEWGHSPVFHFDERGMHFKEIAYSPGMDRLYQKRYGRSLREDLLHLRYGEKPARIRVINQYLENLRDRMGDNETWFYTTGKRVFGPKTFIASHPTWWGGADDFYLEVFNNGLHWWQARRDFGQTDEKAMIPIRLALAHKWGGHVWYNMFYSAGTEKLEPYFPETWGNARWGGRTHHLGYECPNEPGVCEFDQEGRLEAVWKMEERIKKLNAFQRAAPDSRVLVLFGMEACTNWEFTETRSQVFRNVHPRLQRAARFAQSLFEGGYLCDFVPTSEIANGSLQLKDGRVTYGTQTYDSVILLEPDALPVSVYRFFASWPKGGTPLYVFGTAEYLADGSPAAEAFQALVRQATYATTPYPGTAEMLAFLRDRGVPGNRFPLGCVLQDGSMLFTAQGVRPTGNTLSLDLVHQGRRLRFEGEDFLGVSFDQEGRVVRWTAGASSLFEMDGKPVALPPE